MRRRSAWHSGSARSSRRLGGELHRRRRRCRSSGIAPLRIGGADDDQLPAPTRSTGKQLAASRAGCVIVAPAMREAAAARGAAIVAPDPYLYFARLTQLVEGSARAGADAGDPPQRGRSTRDALASIATRPRSAPLCVGRARSARIGAGTRAAGRA